MKLKEIARQVGVSPAYLSQVRHGVRPPSEEIKQKLSNLGIEIKQIIKQSVKNEKKRKSRLVEPDVGNGYNRGSVGDADTSGADESRWASRTSNPLGGADNAFGGFDSHALPPKNA